MGRAGVPELTPGSTVEVASPLDLLATKLKVMQQRIEVKDYWDVAALLRSGVQLEMGLAAARAMYYPTFEPSEAARALTYFEGGDLSSLAENDKAILIGAVAQMRRIPVMGLASRSLSARTPA